MPLHHHKIMVLQIIIKFCYLFFKLVNGFKAPSPLLQLSSFDLPKGIAIDYMHGICLGVVKTMVDLWFDSTNSTHSWYCGNRLHEVDKRLLQIKPPNIITRVPRSVEGHRKHWKGTYHFRYK